MKEGFPIKKPRPTTRIVTEYDYHEALREMGRLWDNAVLGSPSGDRFSQLARMIADYEKNLDQF